MTNSGLSKYILVDCTWSLLLNCTGQATQLCNQYCFHVNGLESNELFIHGNLTGKKVKQTKILLLNTKNSIYSNMFQFPNSETIWINMRPFFISLDKLLFITTHEIRISNRLNNNKTSQIMFNSSSKIKIKLLISYNDNIIQLLPRKPYI